MNIKDELIKYVKDRSDRTIDDAMVECMVYWFLSVVINKKKRHIVLGRNKILINFYGLVFAKSNSGKSYILNLLLDLFDEKGYTFMLNSLFDARTKALPNGDKADVALQKKFIKAFPPIKKDSTTQAIHKAAEAISTAAFTNGSFNIYSDELFANASQPILDMLVEGHDGIYKAPMIKGNKDDLFLEYTDISDLTTNVLGLSSVAAVMKDQKALSKFIGEMERAWFKRSYVYFNDSFQPVAKEAEDIRTNTLSLELRHLLDMGKESVTECIEDITISPEAMEIFNEHRKIFINGEIKSEFNHLLDIYKTLKLAGIICTADHRSTITSKDFQEALSYDYRAFTMATNFCTLEHPHIRAYQKLERVSLYENELVENGLLPAAKNARKDTIELVEQLAYTKNKRLVIAGSKVKKLSIEELEINKLDKMIVSTSAKISAKPEMEINFKSQEVGFFGTGMTMESLITSKIQSYCLNHFEASDKAQDGHRKREYIIPGQTMIAWDIDEGMSVDEAKSLLSMYTYILYTTKSHQIDKNGIICDRFRIIMPTKTMYYVDAEQHKQMYTNMAEILGLNVYDIQTKNQGRLWYTNQKATIYTNKGELIDIRVGIPDTEAEQKIMPNLENLKPKDDDEMSRRIYGMQKFVLTNGLAGSRNDMIFRMAKFIHEIGGDMQVVHETNQMLMEPLNDGEINTIIKGIR